jgi:putative aminopeptidase FrvX
MNQQALRFLKELLSKPTPSGYEEPGQRVVSAYMGRYADEVRTDVHGNVHAVLNPGGRYRVMLAGHCDEIGLMIMHIESNGLLYFDCVGGVNVSLLQGERVVVHTEKGDIPGVIGVKPPHLMDAKEREGGKPIHAYDLWIDIGAKDKREAARLVQPGDVATIASGWTQLRGRKVACRGFDDRAGAFVIADVLRQLAGKSLNVAVHAISTVQEEIGLRGAHTAAHAVDPLVGIAVDVTFATDQPDVDAKRVGEAALGKGPVLHRGANFNRHVFKGLQTTAKRLKVGTQIQPITRGSPTDANAIQLARAGVAAALISIPTRYIHSPVEVIDLADLEATPRLIAAFIAGLRGNESFIP